MNSELGIINTFYGRDVFITPIPEVLDFTNTHDAKLVVYTKEQKVSIPLYDDRKKLSELASCLETHLAGSNMVLGWGIKDLLSYVLAITGEPMLLEKVFDLKIMESYLGIENPIPQSFQQAWDRLREVTKHQSWFTFKKIYSDVYIPLITRVVPKIETLGLAHKSQNAILHPHYEIDGQVNGRMKCSKILANCFNPHLLVEQDKENLRPPEFESMFMYLDFKHMEVSVLHWLSSDPLLDKILRSGKDVYEGIWGMITGQPCTEIGRQKCKSIFLPIVFGLGVDGVAEKIGCTRTTAEKLTKLLREKFKTAMDWAYDHSLNKDGYCVDCFGRNRKFGEQSYKIRNFVVQSPASLICLHKLVKLSETIDNLGKICFHLHDGYAIIVNRLNVKKLAEVAIETLERAEDLYPGLRLKVTLKVGNNLNKLEPLYATA